MPDPSYTWIIIAVLICLSFFFSASETAIACCNRFKVQSKADEGNKTAKLLLKIIDKYERTLTIVLIGNNVVAIAIASLSTVLFLYYFQSTGMTEYNISLLASVVMSFVVYMLGDTLPKTIARSIPDTLSFAFTYPLYILMIILTPIAWVFEKVSHLISTLFKLKAEDDFTEEDLSNAIEEASENEMIDEEQADIVQSAIDFLDTNVKEVLTPKDKIFALNLKNLNHEELQQIITNTKYSRIPIYDKVFDNVVGVLNVKIYFEEFMKDPHVDIRSVLQKPYFVSNKIMIDDLFNGFKKRHTHMALVRDNHQKIVGMVTMEDILEEIVSDISEPSSLPKRRKA